MDNDLMKYFEKIDLNAPSTEQEIERVEKTLSFRFPDDYRQILLKHNGGEGSIGSNSYLVLWSVNDIIELNEAYEVHEFAPGLILFGTDGSDNAYAFDIRTDTKNIVNVPFIGMDLDEITVCADRFRDFLDYLYN